MEYALWEDEPMGPAIPQLPANTSGSQGQGNGLQIPYEPSQVQQVVMESRPAVHQQQVPLGNGTPAVSAPPMMGEQTRKDGSMVVPAVTVGGAATAYALTQPDLKNIGYYAEASDLWYIIVAVLVIDVIVIFLTRYFPATLGSNLNRWYTTFGLNGVIADVLIIVLVFLVARYIYTNYVEPNMAERVWSPWIFIGLFVGLGIIHDIGFYKFVIQPISRGTNSMIDLFKDYAESAGATAIFGDALMVAGSAILAMILKGQPDHVTGFLGVLAAYCVPYILHTKPGGGAE